jgi:acetyl esterase/lipase
MTYATLLIVGSVAAVLAGGKVIDDAVVGQTVEADEFHQAFSGPVGINLHLPDQPNADTGLLVMLHGWGGDYHQYDSYCEDWRNRFNCICLQVNYRGSSKATQPYDFGKYQAIDVLRAVQWVRRNCAVNGRRIIGWGGSGGGNVILQCAVMAPHTFALVIECAGITHPTSAAEAKSGWDNYASRPGGWQGTALGGTREYPEPERLLRDPCSHAKLFGAKVFIFHPDRDTTVGLTHATQLAYRLREAEKEVVLEIIEGGDHMWGGALDPCEKDRKVTTETYASEDILHRRTDGVTDFGRGQPVVIPVNDGLVYRVLYGEDGLPRLEGPVPGSSQGGTP